VVGEGGVAAQNRRPPALELTHNLDGYHVATKREKGSRLGKREKESKRRK